MPEPVDPLLPKLTLFLSESEAVLVQSLQDSPEVLVMLSAVALYENVVLDLYNSLESYQHLSYGGVHTSIKPKSALQPSFCQKSALEN